MDKKEIFDLISELYHSQGESILPASADIVPEYVGLRLFDAPVVGFASAEDPLFELYKKPGVIGPWHMSPREWLPGAEMVISLFFPITKEIRESNAREQELASLPWLYARIEGQAFIGRYMQALAEKFREAGAAACVPQGDPRWQSVKNGEGIEGYDEMTPETFGSRWSERHAAYICGLGTFGLSKGLITKRGIAGRFASVVTDLAFEPDPRPYTGVYDYCIHCGACVARCPVGAIDPVKGKDHVICSQCLDRSRELFRPRYGCGLCQTGVPCEDRDPSE